MIGINRKFRRRHHIAIGLILAALVLLVLWSLPLG